MKLHQNELIIKKYAFYIGEEIISDKQCDWIHKYDKHYIIQ